MKIRKIKAKIKISLEFSLLASGTVDAGVDLSHLNAAAITVDENRKTATLRLPHATLRKPQLDLANSTIVQHNRGLLDRLGSTFGNAPTGESQALRLAEKKLNAAAKESTVVAVAETNTRAMMTTLVRGLGFDTVIIQFVDPLAASPITVPPVR